MAALDGAERASLRFGCMKTPRLCAAVALSVALVAARAEAQEDACRASRERADGLLEAGESHDPESHLMPLVLRVAAGEATHVQIFGQDYPTPDGTCIRDFIHVRDLAAAHLLALEATGESDASLEVYNLGSAAGFSVREVVEAARRVTGRAIPARPVKRRVGDPPVLVASSRRARRELGWQPAHSTLEHMLADAWAWRLAHPDGYADRHEE